MYTVVPSGVLASGRARARDQKMLHIGAIFEDVIVRATLSSEISMQSPKIRKTCLLSIHNSFGNINMTCR